MGNGCRQKTIWANFRSAHARKTVQEIQCCVSRCGLTCRRHRLTHNMCNTKIAALPYFSLSLSLRFPGRFAYDYIYYIYLLCASFFDGHKMLTKETRLNATMYLGVRWAMRSTKANLNSSTSACSFVEKNYAISYRKVSFDWIYFFGRSFVMAADAFVSSSGFLQSLSVRPSLNRPVWPQAVYDCVVSYRTISQPNRSNWNELKFYCFPVCLCVADAIFSAGIL